MMCQPIGAFFMPTPNSSQRPLTSKIAMEIQTCAKNRRKTWAISGKRCGGASCSAAALRNANSMNVTPPSQTMAAAMCKNFIKADMVGLSKQMVGNLKHGAGCSDWAIVADSTPYRVKKCF